MFQTVYHAIHRIVINTPYATAVKIHEALSASYSLASIRKACVLMNRAGILECDYVEDIKRAGRPSHMFTVNQAIDLEQAVTGIRQKLNSARNKRRATSKSGHTKFFRNGVPQTRGAVVIKELFDVIERGDKFNRASIQKAIKDELGDATLQQYLRAMVASGALTKGKKVVRGRFANKQSVEYFVAADRTKLADAAKLRHQRLVNYRSPKTADQTPAVAPIVNYGKIAWGVNKTNSLYRYLVNNPDKTVNEIMQAAGSNFTEKQIRGYLSRLMNESRIESVTRPYPQKRAYRPKNAFVAKPMVIEPQVTHHVRSLVMSPGRSAVIKFPENLTAQEAAQIQSLIAATQRAA